MMHDPWATPTPGPALARLGENAPGAYGRQWLCVTAPGFSPRQNENYGASYERAAEARRSKKAAERKES